MIVPFPGADKGIVIQYLECVEQVPLFRVGETVFPAPVKAKVEALFVYQVPLRVHYLPRPYEAGVGYAFLTGVELAHAHYHIHAVVGKYVKKPVEVRL